MSRMSLTRTVKKMAMYAKRHYDFLVLDILMFAAAYFIAVLLRKSLNIVITREDLFLKYGMVAATVYIVVEFHTRNLNGILYRSFAREAGALLGQMATSWAFFTVILYLYREAHEYSRTIYLVAFVSCYIFILLARTLWKAVLRYSRLHEKMVSELLVVCEANRVQKVLDRLLPGSFENYYNICGIVVNGEGEYHDRYPYQTGLEHITDYIKDDRVHDAYIELDDPKEEAAAMQTVLDAGITVHRSLSDSVFDFMSQRVGKISGKSVITIEDSRTHLFTRLDHLLRKLHRKISRRRADRND